MKLFLEILTLHSTIKIFILCALLYIKTSIFCDIQQLQTDKKTKVIIQVRCMPVWTLGITLVLGQGLTQTTHLYVTIRA